MLLSKRTRQIKEKAQALGFSLVGVTTPDPPLHLDAYTDWLAAGRHGDMGYLATPSSLERRADPKRILPKCQSILVLGIPYANPDSLPPFIPTEAPTGRVAAYAWGDDYHDVLEPRLQLLVAFIEELVGEPVPNRYYTDTGPILERELAQRAGLGWIGKNTMLINPKSGSYYLLAEVLLGIELEIDDTVTTDHCGTCTRCIEACPTDCILPDRTLDAERCISYATIELKGAVPTELRMELGDWVFGCDICQQVCPWNERFAPEDGDSTFAPRPGLQLVDLEEELSLTPQEFNRKYKGSPVKRTKRRGYLRSVAVALGNAGLPRSIPALARALQEEPEPVVRRHLAWALGQIGSPEAKATLVAAMDLENDECVQLEIRAALELSS